MTNTTEALKMAIDFLGGSYEAHKVRKACQEALESQEQEPVAYLKEVGGYRIIDFAHIDEENAYPVYTHPAQPLTRDWIGTALERADKDEAFRKGLIGELAQPLSDDEIKRMYAGLREYEADKIIVAFARAIEQAHGIK